MVRGRRVRLAFFSAFARRTCSASSAGDWGGVFKPREHRVHALLCLAIIAFLTVHARENSNMTDESEDRFDRYAGKGFAPYVSALGQLALAWNDLHEALAGLFWTLMNGPPQEGTVVDRTPIHIWHSLRSDLAQREMLKAAVTHSITDWGENRKEWFKEDVLWVLDKTMDLSHARNDAIHSPLFLNVFGPGPATLIPLHFTFNPRAIGLAKRNDLLGEFRYCRDVAITLHDYARLLDGALVNPQRAWPGRPGMPVRRQKKSQKGFRGRSRS